jgi:hypothetical protein
MIAFRQSVPLLCVLVLLSAGAASAQDIACGCTKKTFDRPGNCQKSCTKTITCGAACIIQPKCSALNVQAFDQFYNRAVFGIGNVGLLGMAGPPAKDVLVAWTINYWFKPNKNTDFNIGWGEKDTDDWAHVEAGSSPGAKPTLTVAADAIWLSPSGLVNALGHEMIHVEQIKRHYSVRMAGINSALSAFRELEASTWETGASDFKWSVGPSKWSSCLPKDEKEGSDTTRQCRDWQVKKAIESIRGGMRSTQSMPALEKYINEDPWISQIWLPQHKNWKTITAGPQPADCPNP